MFKKILIISFILLLCSCSLNKKEEPSEVSNNQQEEAQVEDLTTRLLESLKQDIDNSQGHAALDCRLSALLSPTEELFYVDSRIESTPSALHLAVNAASSTSLLPMKEISENKYFVFNSLGVNEYTQLEDGTFNYFYDEFREPKDYMILSKLLGLLDLVESPQLVEINNVIDGYSVYTVSAFIPAKQALEVMLEQYSHFLTENIYSILENYSKDIDSICPVNFYFDKNTSKLVSFSIDFSLVLNQILDTYLQKNPNNLVSIIGNMYGIAIKIDCKNLILDKDFEIELPWENQEG